jgi:hypothetical protein
MDRLSLFGGANLPLPDTGRSLLTPNVEAQVASGATRRLLTVRCSDVLGITLPFAAPA